jgi:pimeloyl-ACP methyl ester carboxylesterase
MEMLREQTFDSGPVTINFVEGPASGPALVLLHGGGDLWQGLLPIIPSLTTGWHVYALDLRGHGKSGRAPGQYRPEQYVPDIAAFLQRRVKEHAILFGHSLGGWIALLAAAELGDHVRALILGDPPLCMESWVAHEGSERSIAFYRTLRDLVGSGLSAPELATALADMPISVPGQDTPVRYGDLPGRDAAHIRAWAETLSGLDPDVAQYHAEGRMDGYVRQVDLDAALRRLTCPVLILQGGVVSDGDAEHALSLLAHGAHVKIEGADHSLGLDTGTVAPLLRAMTDFLASL